MKNVIEINSVFEIVCIVFENSSRCYEIAKLKKRGNLRRFFLEKLAKL